jgi:hypothetical protein
MPSEPAGRASILKWRTAIEAARADLLPRFEARFGYEAGENTIGEPASASVLAAAAAHPALPQALLDFYGTIGEVSLPDVGNGYFIHSLALVLAELDSDDPFVVRRIPGDHDDEVVVFGSDGGGTRYALAARTGPPVYRLDSDGGVDHGLYRFDRPGWGPVAADLSSFLELLHRAVWHFVDTGEPGSL